MTFILELNAYHGDSSACLVVGGKLVAAAEDAGGYPRVDSGTSIKL